MLEQSTRARETVPHLFVALLCCLVLTTQLAAADLKTIVEPLVEPLTKDRPAVGLVVGIWVDGGTHVFGFGRVTTPCGDSCPDGDTLFEIGSVTKAFTGVLLAEAMVRREVVLDDPANQHMPKDLSIKPKTDKPITLLDLATHRSGLPLQPPRIAITARNPANPYADFTRTKLSTLMAELQPTREPGESYEYSNLAVGLLGALEGRAVHRSGIPGGPVAGGGRRCPQPQAARAPWSSR